MRKRKILIALVFVLVLLVFLFTLIHNRFKNSADVEPTSKPPARRISFENDVVLYKDSALKISFEYPKDWRIYPSSVEGESRTTIITNFDLDAADPMPSLKSDEIKISISSTNVIPKDVESYSDFILENFFSPEAVDIKIKKVAFNRMEGYLYDYVIYGVNVRSIYLKRESDTIFINVNPGGESSDYVLDVILNSIQNLE